MKTSVMLVDDHKMFRDGLRLLISMEPDLEVIAEAESGEEAIELTRRLRPQIIVMDISMPGMDGITATRKIIEEMPETRIIAVTMHTDEAYLMRVLQAGALGYILKDDAYEELAQAIRLAAKKYH